MKKNPTPVLLDRLTHALERHGVKLRRQQLLETAAYAFACRSSDEFSKALKAGQLDVQDVVPMGRVSLPDGTRLLIVKDPLASRPYGIEESFIEHVVDSERRERIGLTPYGHLIDLLPLLEADIGTIVADAGDEQPRTTMHGCIAKINRAIMEIDGYTAADDESDHVGQCELALTRAVEAADAGRTDDVHIELSNALESLAIVQGDDADRHVQETRANIREAQKEIKTSVTRPTASGSGSDSRLRPFLMMALEQIDQEIENRGYGVDDSASSELKRVSDTCHAAARGIAPEPFGDDDVEAIRISRKDLGILLDAAMTRTEGEESDELDQAISDVRTRLEMPVVTPAAQQERADDGRTIIYVATMVHKHGSDIRVAASQKDLDAQIAEFCRENWSDIDHLKGVPSHPDGMTDAEVASLYYEKAATIGDDYVEEMKFDIPTSQLVPTGIGPKASRDDDRPSKDAGLPDPSVLVTITDTDGGWGSGIDASTMAELRLPFLKEAGGDHPLTEKEQAFASPDVRLNCHLDHPVTLGRTVLHQGRKWLAPSIEFAWDPMQEGFTDDAAAGAERMDEYVRHIEPFVRALGGSIHASRDATEMSHELTILLPFDLAFESASVEDWNAALAYLLSTKEEKRKHGTVTCEFIAQKDFGRSVFSVDPLGDTVWDGTFDALRWGTQEAIAILTDETDADDYARSPMAPEWVREWTEKHPFEVDPIGLERVLRIAL